MQNIMFIRLDVHKATISVAVAQGDRVDEVWHWGTIPNRADHVRKLADKLGSDGRLLHFCYEAGPGGRIRFSTAASRSGEYPTSSSYPAHLRNRGKLEQRTTSLTQGGRHSALGWKSPVAFERKVA